MPQPTVISLFAGCGGSSLGYRMAGYRELLAVERDANAADTFALNFPGVPVYRGDIAALSADECMALAGVTAGELDVLDGSPPCQGFSMVGRRDAGDARNALYREYVRLLDALRPKAFVFENVRGLVSGRMLPVYAEIVAALRGCGYAVKAEVKNAMWYGVPQSRERVIIVGIRIDLGLAPSLPKPQAHPVAAADACAGVPNDPAEVAALLEDAAKRPHLRLWDRIEPGGKGSDASGGNHFSLRRLHPLRPCPTITKFEEHAGAGGLMHWAERRKLTVAEAKRLSSFPDDFAFAGTRSDAMARIGNCVPPLLIRAVALHLREVLGL